MGWHLIVYSNFSEEKVCIVNNRLDRFVSSKIYDKRNDFDLDIVNFPFLDGDVPRSTS